MTEFSNSVKPNLSLHNTKVTLSLAPYYMRINNTTLILISFTIEFGTGGRTQKAKPVQVPWLRGKG